MSLDEKNLYPIGGQGGSGGGSTPSEDPDTLQSHTFVSILDLLGEGQIGGLVGTNTVEKEKSIYIDGTPMRTNGGTENFKGVSWAERTGTQDQSYIDGYGSIETPTSVNVQLKFNVPKVISITNSRVDEVRIILAIGGLMVTESDGDIRGSSVSFSIGMATNSGASSEVAARTIKGKASSRYQVAYTVKLPKVANDGTPITRWDIQVTRTTSDSTKTGTQNDLYFDSYSEVITKKLTYPNSALVATRVNSEHFSSMPKREYLVDGLLIKVPSNYNHVTREYTGIWDGSFKLAPTSNPAWIMFDILTNNRYGLGEYIDAGLVDEARLYQIGRYCDQMVDDGFGNLEPRYTINCTINSRAEAYDLITDICSAFNGMSYWAGGQVGFTIDAPSDPVMAFTSANIEGEFGYSGTSVKDRHSIAVVTWNDPKDDYKQAVEYVEDPDLIERYGVRKIEIQAFGCTSRAQAHRYGRWILYTEHQQSEVCSFTAGMDASTLMPGSIIQIQDEHRAGKRFGGRLISCTATSAILDDDIDFTGFETGLKFAVMLSDGSFVERDIATKVTRTTVIGTTGNTHTATEVTWVTSLENLPVSQAVWVISAPNLELVQARVVGVKQGVDLDKFDISVIPHNPNKYAAIEKNVMLEVPPTSILSSRNQVPPSEVRIKQEVLVHQGLSKTRLVIDWERADKAIRYSVEWKRDEDNWVRLPETANLSAEVEDVYTGTYIARVTAIGMSGARSYPQYSVSADLTGKSGNLALPVAFEAHGILFGMEMSWAYPANSKDSSHVVIEVSDTNNVADAKLLAAVPYPATTHTVTGLMGNLTQYYRIKLVDKSGNESEFTPFVSAKTLEDPEILIEMLSGHVDKIVLSPEVVDQIEQATADNAQNRADLLAETAARIAELQATQNDLVTEVDARIAADATEAAARATDIASEAAARSTAIATAIATEAEARAAESTARANAIMAEETARNAAINAKVAEINANIATQIDAVQDGIDQEVIDRTDAVSAVRGELNTYKTSNDSAVATALQKVEAVTTAHDATVTELDALQSSFEDLTGDLSATTSDLSSFKQTVANADAALGTRIDNLTTTVNTNNTAVNGRITNVETSITTLESNVNTKTSQLQSSLDTTNTNVTAAQNAANAANTLAGGKGKVLYQSTAPATADRLSKNLWIDTTGNTNTPKRWNGTAWVAVTDKVATDALAAANAANTAVATKADASAVNALTTRVTTAEGTITSQGTRVTNLENSVNHATTGLATKASTTALNSLDSKVTSIDGRVTANATSITNLQAGLTTANDNIATKADGSALNSLTTRVSNTETALDTQSTSLTNLNSSLATTNTNVATAQQAATNAATLAGGKGKVLVQSTAPAVADQLAQNLWIDTTGNANTPKRWTGSAWVAVTDKVATDAATAAAAAQATANTKADATALTSLTTRVTTAEGNITSQGTRVTNLENSVNHATTGLASKASSSALTAVDNKVTAANGRIDTTNSDVTTLTGRVSTVEGAVATKAEASALTALTTRVTNAEGVNTSQGSAITTLQNTVNHATTGLATKASTSALTATNSEVSRVNGVVTGHTSQLTQLASDITTINGNLATKADASALNDIYTKTQADAKATEIAAGEVAKYDASLVIGGSNLYYGENPVNLVGRTSTGEFKASTDRTAAQMYTYLTNKLDTSALSVGDSTIASIEVFIPSTNPSDFNFNFGTFRFSAGSYVLTPLHNTADLPKDRWVQIAAPAGKFLALREGNDINVVFNLSGNILAGSTLRWRNLMMEKGSKPSAYSESDKVAQAALDANAVAITTTNAEVSRINGVVVAQGTSITNLQAGLTTANNNIATKADGSALTSLTTRVSTAEGNITSQSTRITNLENSVNHATTGLSTKASTSALSTLDTKVTGIDGRVTTNASNITTLQGKMTTVENGLTTKADSSALSALTTRVSNAEGSITSQGSSITSLTNSLSVTSTTATDAELLARYQGQGKLLFNDTTFKAGVNNTVAYNTHANVTAIVRQAARSGNPSGSSFELVRTFTGDPNVSNLGYVPNPMPAAANKVFLHKIVASIPVGFTIGTATNGVGTGGTDAIVGTNAGTGKFETYWRLTRCGAAGTFDGTGHITMKRASATAVPTASAPADFVLAQWAIYDVTQAADALPKEIADKIDATATATDTLSTTVTNLNGTVTSQGSRLTNLENSVNSTTNGLATKASSTALDTLSNKVNHSTTGLDAIANKATALETQVNAIKVGGSNLFALKELRRYNAGTLYTTTGTYFTVAGTQITGAGMAATDRIGNAIPYTEGQDLTIAFTVVSNITDANIYYRCLNVSGVQTKAQTKAVATITGTRYTLTLPASSFPTGTATVNLGFGGTATNPVVKDVVVQLGNMATAWTESYRDSPDMTLYAGAQALTDLTTRVNTAEGKITSQATSITNLSTTVGNQTTSISTLTTSVNGINASHTVKINNNGYSAGFGLISTGVNGVTTSAFKVDADFFEVGKSGTGIKPFIIVSSANQVIEGVTYPTAGTYINSAKIANATIKLAHIDTASIGSLSAISANLGTIKVGSANIEDGAITNAKIDDAAITSAKIGDLEVDSIKIKDNAVSTNIAVTGASSVTVTTASSSRLTITIGITTDFVATENAYNTQLRLFRNGTAIKTFDFKHTSMVYDGGDSHRYSYVFTCALPSVIDMVAQGTYVYSVQVLTPQNYSADRVWGTPASNTWVKLSNLTLGVMELKK